MLLNANEERLSGFHLSTGMHEVLSMVSNRFCKCTLSSYTAVIAKPRLASRILFLEGFVWLLCRFPITNAIVIFN